MTNTSQKAIFMRFSDPNHALQIYILIHIPNNHFPAKLKSYRHQKSQSRAASSSSPCSELGRPHSQPRFISALTVVAPAKLCPLRARPLGLTAERPSAALAALGRMTRPPSCSKQSTKQQAKLQAVPIAAGSSDEISNELSDEDSGQTSGAKTLEIELRQ